MLTIVVPPSEEFNQETSEFHTYPGGTLQLEHSLISLSKWESKWHKPFLSDKDKTNEELRDYIRCMTVTQKVDPDIYTHLTRRNVQDINAYINDPMTATWFTERPGQHVGRKSSEAITSELIYYWMIAFGIPVEFERWHLNRLLTLIRVCEVKNQPSKKMSKKDIYAQNRALNAARRKATGSKG